MSAYCLLQGNLAPEFAVGKITGKEGTRFSGPARCFDCAPGFFQPQSNQTSCVACPGGYYQGEAGQPDCTPEMQAAFTSALKALTFMYLFVDAVLHVDTEWMPAAGGWRGHFSDFMCISISLITPGTHKRGNIVLF